MILGISRIVKLGKFTKGEYEKENRRGIRTEPRGPSAPGTVLFKARVSLSLVDYETDFGG